MEIKESVLDILAEITGTNEVKEDPDLNLFEEGLLDSLGAVQLLLDLEVYCHVRVAPTEFDRDQWATPAKIVAQVERRLA
jgi:D-alanine--poly(phosphoribitol) ligase subunit 2